MRSRLINGRIEEVEGPPLIASEHVAEWFALAQGKNSRPLVPEQPQCEDVAKELNRMIVDGEPVPSGANHWAGRRRIYA